MKLLIATPFLETRGGVERTILKIARHFKAKINCLYYDSENTFEEFQKLEIDAKNTCLSKRIPFEKRLIGGIEAGHYFYTTKLEDYDIVNAHQTPSEWIRNKNSPVIWYCHTPNREAFDLYEWRMKKRNSFQKLFFGLAVEIFKVVEKKTVPKIEYIFTNSKNSQKRIFKYLGRRSEVLYPGVEYTKFTCKDHENFFFYPSRIVPEKDIEYAIDAFKIFESNMRKRKKNEKWKLIIAGSLSQRPEHKYYFEKIKKLTDESIEIYANVTDSGLLDLYSRCYAVIYTPINEDFGLIPLEAMSSSKPCIARNEGGPKETILNNVDGFLVDSKVELAKKMELLANDFELCVTMGKNGRKKVEKCFRWEDFLKRFEEKCNEIIEINEMGV
ncbi:MAG: glycosyltransferase [Candidatus Aenigmarchaeota archaeon]|nr:glycosyltransferase [Candidatus Aenigmarchaeota archaeon]